MGGVRLASRHSSILAQLILNFKLLNFTYCRNPDTFRDLYEGIL
jgi:hypothetical protein